MLTLGIVTLALASLLLAPAAARTASQGTTARPVAGSRNSTASSAARFRFPKWRRSQTIDTHSVIESVSCATAQMCVALGSTPIFWNGARWKHSKPLAMDARHVSCPTVNFCMAVGATTDGFERGGAARWNGKKWSHPVSVGATNGVYLNAVSCTSAKFCLAADVAGGVVKWNGRGWSGPVAVGDSVLTAIECASRKFCVTGDGFGVLWMYKKGIWHQTPPITGFSDITSISCHTRTFCMAADGLGQGFVSKWNGRRWSAMKHIDNEATQAVSCPTTTYCVATDDQGFDVVYNGRRWSRMQRIAELFLFKSVSCPTKRFCVTTTSNAGGAWWTPLPSRRTRRPRATRATLGAAP